MSKNRYQKRKSTKLKIVCDSSSILKNKENKLGLIQSGNIFNLFITIHDVDPNKTFYSTRKKELATKQLNRTKFVRKPTLSYDFLRYHTASYIYYFHRSLYYLYDKYTNYTFTQNSNMIKPNFFTTYLSCGKEM